MPSSASTRVRPTDRRSEAPTIAIERGRSSRSSDIDRKSTRLNSSHSQISYAVFCLQNKDPPCVNLHYFVEVMHSQRAWMILYTLASGRSLSLQLSHFHLELASSVSRLLNVFVDII